jgi:hypothetical protein
MMQRVKNTRGGIIFELLFICVGLGLIFSACVAGTETYAFINKAEMMEGSIVDVIDHGFTVDVQFKPELATIVAFPQHGFFFNMTPGDQVQVLYDPERASTASINRFSAIWFMVGLKLIGGLALLGIGVKVRTARNL